VAGLALSPLLLLCYPVVVVFQSWRPQKRSQVVRPWWNLQVVALPAWVEEA
jgi:hypothetical protein